MPSFTVYRKDTGEVIKIGNASDQRNVPRETEQLGVIEGRHDGLKVQIDPATRRPIPRTIPLPDPPPRPPLLAPRARMIDGLASSTPIETSAKLDELATLVRELAERVG